MNDRVTAIDIDGATKIFPNGVHALGPVNLAILEGEFATIIGSSGCGKSTLLRVIAGLLPPTAGSVELWPSARAAEDTVAKRVAFVFQSATLMAWANVEKNVRLPLDLQNAQGSETEAKIDHALALVGLQDFRRAYPRELSGGMQMRASIARALVTEPRLLLMDEPFGALDEITRGRLDRDLRDMWAQEALTVLFVTHSIYEAVYLSTRVFVMSARPGRIFGEVIVDEPHPRTDGFRVSDTYSRCCARLSELLTAASATALSVGGACA